MDATRRLERMKNNGNHVFYFSMAIGIGYAIALMLYSLFILILQSL